MEQFGNMQSEENDKFVLLYKLYYKQMLYAAKQILRDHCEAENAVQEAFLGLSNHLHKIEDVYKRESRAGDRAAGRQSGGGTGNTRAV